MSALLDATTRVVVQGLTGTTGSMHSAEMRKVGTNVVAGVSPGRGGASHEGIPLFDTVRDAVRATGAGASGIFIPARFAADAIMEAAAAGVSLICCATEGMPVQEMVRVMEFLREHPGTRLVGPNASGVLVPGVGKIGFIPHRFSMPGRTGVVARSSTLMYEVMAALTAAGIGQSMVIGIGGDPVHGLSLRDAVRLFDADPDTAQAVLIGEIGGREEELAAAALAASPGLRGVALVAGRAVPPGRSFGHAGAIVHGLHGAASRKVAAFHEAGVPVSDTIEGVVRLLG